MDNLNEIGDRLLVVFDGCCGLCNRSVRWLVRRDREDRLRFVAAESAKGSGLLERHGISAAELGTIWVVRDAGGAAERALSRSEAVLAVLGELPGPWPWVAAGMRGIPRPLRDLGYRLVARWRYRIWGKLESCPVPAPEERERFL
jgi:predicted DCC family thiol-disulfide oxidoreductase YuxK